MHYLFVPFGSFMIFQTLEHDKVAGPGFDLQRIPAAIGCKVACLGTVFVKCRTQMNSDFAGIFPYIALNVG